MMHWYWAVWFLIGFGVPEGIAMVRRHYQDTLSWTVWRWCDIVPGNTFGQFTFLRYLLIVGLLFAFLHLGFGLLRG
ncbi:MAG TPA: hypothetical protein VGH54_21540 [Mycobacterium sp.]|jgi:hypothetical protein|uniref:hypothetical protein n=1 Tax=Mycobacterium sp. TaxID=1785 RepID=UPI002F41D002